ncbi:hypothetical protein [Microseira wollei]|uniref:hypothetical protein n=1 Tax=Microseira wollei TaxID=467598 RepID=UPI001CFD13DD|nr:hypothetical protein [Microseira wollei]
MSNPRRRSPKYLLTPLFQVIQLAKVGKVGKVIKNDVALSAKKITKTLQRQDRYLTPQSWQQMCNNAILTQVASYLSKSG